MTSGDVNLTPEDVDDSLANWKQGDCVVGTSWFVHRFEARCPLTDLSRGLESTDSGLVEGEVAGFAVISQTCDIIRSCAERPFLEIAPLVLVSDEERLVEIERGRRPRYCYVPSVARQGLVIDLDRVMTVEKSVVACWDRTPGFSDETQARKLSEAIARKRLRFAFPNDFVEFAQGLKKHLQKKHKRQHEEGHALRSLSEIRVKANPGWEADRVELLFWFIRDLGDPPIEDRNWEDLLERWLQLVPASGRFEEVNGVVVTYDDMTAQEYVESNQLDLDHLSLPEQSS